MAKKVSRKPRGEGAAEHRSSGMHPWLLALLVLSLLLVVGGGLGVLLLRRLMVRSMTPEAAARMENFLTEPVTIPETWRHNPPFDPAVIAAEKALDTVWTRDRGRIYPLESEARMALERAQRQMPLSDEHWTSLTELAIGAKHVLDATSATVALPHYELGARPGGLWLLLPGDRWVSGAACAAAHLEARHGNYSLAFQWLLLPVRRAVRRPSIDDVLHMHSCCAIQAAMASIAALCVHCSDSRLLRLVLQELNERRNQVHHRALAKRELLTAVSLLQNYARGGYPVDLSSGKPSVWYFDQMMRASKEFPGWKANQLGIADPLRPEYEKMPDYIAGLGAERPFWVEACGEFPVRLAFPEAYFLPLLWFHEWEEVELIAETYYDLARVLLARRIRQLEGQEEISRLEELVPELLPEVPRDPFAGKPFQRDGSTGGFYSFGPDRKDNRRKIHWNRHGRSVASPGDIELPEPNMFPPGERWGRL